MNSLNRTESLDYTHPLLPIGVKEFDESVAVWQSQMEDIILGINGSRTSKGVPVSPSDFSTFIDEFKKLVEQARNKVESETFVLFPDSIDRT